MGVLPLCGDIGLGLGDSATDDGPVLVGYLFGDLASGGVDLLASQPKKKKYILYFFDLLASQPWRLVLLKSAHLG